MMKTMMKKMTTTTSKKKKMMMRKTKKNKMKMKKMKIGQEVQENSLLRLSFLLLVHTFSLSGNGWKRGGLLNRMPS